MVGDKEKTRKRFFTDIIICLVISSFVVFLTQFVSIAPLEQLKSKLIDQRFSERGPIGLKDTNVVIVEISQETYDEVPQPWPWPRSLFAKFINNLNEAGARAIGIDIIMSTEDTPHNDSLMIAAIKNHRNVVLAGELNVTRQAQHERNKSMNSGSNSSGGLIRKEHENYNNVYYEADSSVGIVLVDTDQDGVCRRYRPFAYSHVTDQRVPSFGFALLNKYYDLPSTYTTGVEADCFILGDKKIPKIDDVSMLINYYGPDRTFPHYKLIDILDDDEFQTVSEIEYDVPLNAWDDPEIGLKYTGIFKDKIVLLGSTMPVDKDLLPVSFSPGIHTGDNYMYGVEIHANVIQNILSREYLTKQSLFSEILLTFILTFFTYYISSYIRGLKKLKHGLAEVANNFVTVLSLFIIYKLSIYFFIEHNIIIAVISPSLGVLLGNFGNIAVHFLQERKQNVVIKGMFSTYVSSHLVNQLIANPDKLQLGGERKNLSILFSDIAGFTTFSEGKEPEELVRFINLFLDDMTEIILQNQGTLDKYLGDAVMAFWGAPLPIEKHAFYACKTALEMNRKLHQLQEEWLRKGQQPISMRIGINSGDVIVGNIGGKKRFDYTVMGDAVNLASRLEGANKAYGTSIMISETTYNHVQHKFLVRELDNIQVKGKTKPTKVFELIGNSDDVEAKEKINKLQDYLIGLEYYKKAEFEEAMIHFNNSLEQIEKDQPTKVYLDRIQFYIENPPPKNWDGVFIMKTK